MRRYASPMFQHRHYCKIAATIAELPEEMRATVAQHFARELRGTNPGYSESRFVSAANGEPQSGRDRG